MVHVHCAMFGIACLDYLAISQNDFLTSDYPWEFYIFHCTRLTDCNQSVHAAGRILHGVIPLPGNHRPAHSGHSVGWSHGRDKLLPPSPDRCPACQTSGERQRQLLLVSSQETGLRVVCRVVRPSVVAG